MRVPPFLIADAHHRSVTLTRKTLGRNEDVRLLLGPHVFMSPDEITTKDRPGDEKEELKEINSADQF